ncbi:hypothetical protein A0256_23625 [Mucilaginibacter sp. PAMC 26640]|nr:hypothetical protein A0256_23625 [Mucilaginibacter sp. PAMC 26640]
MSTNTLLCLTKAAKTHFILKTGNKLSFALFVAKPMFWRNNVQTHAFVDKFQKVDIILLYIGNYNNLKILG